MSELMTGFRWSFSKLDAANSCLFGFKKTHIDHQPPAENAFAQIGTLCHELLEDYALGKKAVYDLLPAFEKGYRKQITAVWPPYPSGLAEKTHAKIADYFRSFRGFNVNEVKMAEKKLVGTLAGRPYSGILDLVATDAHNKLLIIDHKSSGLSEYRGQKLEQHKMQLLLYAALLRQQTGQQADVLAFNLFKEGVWIRFPWSQEDEDLAIEWAEAIMKNTEHQMDAYFSSLTPPQQSLQRLLLVGHTPVQARRALNLSSTRYRRMMLEMDEAALIFLGHKEPAGDYGCQFICSARNCCEEGGSP